MRNLMRLGEYFDMILYLNCFILNDLFVSLIYVDGLSGHFPIHDIWSNFLRFSIYFNRNLCLK